MSIPRGQLPRKLCARYTQEFAHPTIKDRLPVILTKIVDRLYACKSEIEKKYGQEGSDELKSLIGECSKLKSEMQTNKGLSLLNDDLPDVKFWNDRLSLKVLEENEWREGDDDNENVCVDKPDANTTASWFHSSWLLSEAYFYRRLNSITKQFLHLKDLDLFLEPKIVGTEGSKMACSSLATYLKNSHENGVKDVPAFEKLFRVMLYASLWGNKCDLSISAGADNFQTQDILLQLEELNKNTVCNKTEEILKFVSSFKSDAHSSSSKVLKRFDVILDNTGFELFTDLCFADFITTVYNCKVHWHAKAMPWFVSDVTRKDFNWTIEWMGKTDEPSLQHFHQKWSSFVKEGKWIIEDHPFWSYPHSFHSMESVAVDLYKHLSQADLLLFKGDLNYRKLTGDLRWDYSEKFEKAVGQFRPAPLISLRTLKCDLVHDVPKEVVKKESEKYKEWMLFGTHAVIQFLA